MGQRIGRHNDEEEGRRYYQGPAKCISLNQKTEYMTASHPILLKILNYLLQNRRGPYMTDAFSDALYFSCGKTSGPKATRDYQPRSFLASLAGSEGNPSILELVLKKISWRGPYKQWSEYENELFYH